MSRAAGMVKSAAEKTAAAEAGPARRKCRIPDDDRMPLEADYHKGGRRTAEHTDLWMLHSMAWAVGEPAHTCASGQHCSCAIVTSFGEEQAAAYVALGEAPGNASVSIRASESGRLSSTHSASLWVLLGGLFEWIRESCGHKESIFNGRFYGKGPGTAGTRVLGEKRYKLVAHYRDSTSAKPDTILQDKPPGMIKGAHLFNPTGPKSRDEIALRKRLAVLVTHEIIGAGDVENTVQALRRLGRVWTPCTKSSPCPPEAAVPSSVLGQAPSCAKRRAPPSQCSAKRQRAAGGGVSAASADAAASIDLTTGSASASPAAAARPPPPPPQAKRRRRTTKSAAPGPSSRSDELRRRLQHLMKTAGGMEQLVDLMRANSRVRAVAEMLAERGNTICLAGVLAAKMLDKEQVPLKTVTLQAGADAVVAAVGDEHVKSPGVGDVDSERRWMEDWVTVRNWLRRQARSAEHVGVDVDALLQKATRVRVKCEDANGGRENRLDARIAAAAVRGGDAQWEDVVEDFFHSLTPAGAVANKSVSKTPG